MARVVVDVMLKPEILDPQGQAIANALPTLGFSAITAVRQGKRFEVEIDGEVTDEVLAEVTRAAGTLLSNPVIEDFAVSVDGVASEESEAAAAPAPAASPIGDEPVEPASAAGPVGDEPVAEELATVEAGEPDGSEGAASGAKPAAEPSA